MNGGGDIVLAFLTWWFGSDVTVAVSTEGTLPESVELIVAIEQAFDSCVSTTTSCRTHLICCKSSCRRHALP